MHYFLVLLIVLSSLGLRAQASGGNTMDLETHKTISYLGAGVSKPIFIGKDVEPLGYWQGLQLKSGLFFMQLQWGQTVDKQLDSSSCINRALMLNFGIRASKPTTKRGKMTLGTASIQPKCDFGVSYAHMPHDTIPEGWAYPMSIGAHISPGVIMRLSSLYVIASCDLDALGSVDPIFKRDEKHFNNARGLIVTPNLTVGFDNGWELLAPTIRKGEGTYTVTEFHYTGESWRTYYDPVDGWMEEHTTRGYTTSYTGVYSYQFRRIDGYIGLGPALSFYTNSNVGQTQMLGGQIGMVLGPFRIDGTYTTGTKGLGNGVSETLSQNALYEGKRINYTSSVGATEMSGKVGFNLAHLLYPKHDFRSDYDSRTRILGTTFYGFTIYYKYGQMTFTGTPDYTFEGAEESLDALFDSGASERSASTDARLLPKTSMMQGIGCALNFGMVSVGVEKLKFDKAPIANGFQGTMSVTLPVRKIVHMSRLRAADRKRAKKNQK